MTSGYIAANSEQKAETLDEFVGAWPAERGSRALTHAMLCSEDRLLQNA
jgi:hypothetical protein